LCERHAQELIPTGKISNPMIASIALNAFTKNSDWRSSVDTLASLAAKSPR
jgi:hypothetical protein